MKIRFKTWYWGNYEIADRLPEPWPGQEPDWELYDEEKHGWHNSEEAKLGLYPLHNETKNDTVD